MENSKALTITEQRVATIKSELEFSDALVERVLVAGIDYGLHPGTKSQALKDPGANTIINAFGCYPTSTVLYREVSEVMISYVIDVSLIDRKDGAIKSTGVGAASTREKRYKLRERSDPEATEYWSEQENTILKMARKRAEVDAVMALPGVARFMARLNAGAPKDPALRPPSEDWSGFWSRARALGLADSEVHQILGCKSMKEWVENGRTLEDAIRVLSKNLPGAKNGDEVSDPRS